MSKLILPKRNITLPKKQEGFIINPFMVAPSGPNLTMDGAEFDGNLNYMNRSGTFTGLVGSKTGIVSIWFRPDALRAGSTIFIAEDTTNFVSLLIIRIDNTGTGLYIELNDTLTPAGLLWLDGTGAVLTKGEWHHLLLSWDGATTTKHHYLNDSPLTFSTSNSVSNVSATWNLANQWVIGSAYTSGTFSSEFDGGLLDIYVAAGQYLDFSNVTNRRKFITVDGLPVNDLGATGNLPTGTAPTIFQHLSSAEAPANFVTNRTGKGNYTAGGTLNSATFLPGGSYPPVTIDAADFDGTNDYLIRNSDFTNSFMSAVCLSFWFRADAISVGTTLYDVTTSGGNSRIKVDFITGNKIRFQTWASNASQNLSIQTVNAFSTGVWYHFLGLKGQSSGQYSIYINDVLDVDGGAVTFLTGAVDSDQAAVNYAIGATVAGANKFNGGIAEFHQTNTYMDMSVEANRRNFITSTGKPAYMTDNGGNAVTNLPIIFLHISDGETANNFATNRTSNGNFTVTGALTTYATSPSD